MKISLVIPAYNEEKRIEKAIHEAKKYFDATDYEYEIIVSDDGSSDGTVKRAKDAGAEVICLKHAGKGKAVRAGILKSKGDIVVFTDADLPYDLTLIEKAAEEINAGAGVVIGSRYNGGYGAYNFKRLLYSKVFSFITNSLLHLNINDTQCGFKAFEKDAAKRIFSCAAIDGFGFDTEILYIAKIAKIRIDIVDAMMLSSPESSSVHPIRDGFRMLADIFVIRKNSKKGMYNTKR